MLCAFKDLNLFTNSFGIIHLSYYWHLISDNIKMIIKQYVVSARAEMNESGQETKSLRVKHAPIRHLMTVISP